MRHSGRHRVGTYRLSPSPRILSTLQDVETLTGLVPIGVEGAIIGTALYVGNFTLPDALAVASGTAAADAHDSDTGSADEPR